MKKSELRQLIKEEIKATKIDEWKIINDCYQEIVKAMQAVYPSDDPQVKKFYKNLEELAVYNEHVRQDY